MQSRPSNKDRASPCGGIGRHTSFRNWRLRYAGSSPAEGKTVLDALQSSALQSKALYAPLLCVKLNGSKRNQADLPLAEQGLLGKLNGSKQAQNMQLLADLVQW